VVQLGVSTRTILGTIVGSKTLDGRWAEKAGADQDAPAVITKAMDTTGQTSVVPKRKPAKPTSPVVEPAVTPKPKTPKPPDKPEPAADATEKRAARLLSLAKNYLGAGLKAQALKKLDEIIKKYPNTEAAKKAKEMMNSF
jgi:hypothetical protein